MKRIRHWLSGKLTSLAVKVSPYDYRIITVDIAAAVEAGREALAKAARNF